MRKHQKACPVLREPQEAGPAAREQQKAGPVLRKPQEAGPAARGC